MLSNMTAALMIHNYRKRKEGRITKKTGRDTLFVHPEDGHSLICVHSLLNTYHLLLNDY